MFNKPVEKKDEVKEGLVNGDYGQVTGYVGPVQGVDPVVGSNRGVNPFRYSHKGGNPLKKDHKPNTKVVRESMINAHIGEVKGVNPMDKEHHKVIDNEEQKNKMKMYSDSIAKEVRRPSMINNNMNLKK